MAGVRDEGRGRGPSKSNAIRCSPFFLFLLFFASLSLFSYRSGDDEQLLTSSAALVGLPPRDRRVEARREGDDERIRRLFAVARRGGGRV